MSKGKFNLYTCAKCGKGTITVDRDEGVTPFMIPCPKCEKGDAQSHMYRVPQSGIQPTHEWYTPDDAELGNLMTFPEGRDVYDNHIKRGGLVMREIGGPSFTDRLMKKLNVTPPASPHSFCLSGCETSCEDAKQTQSENPDDFLKIQIRDEEKDDGVALYVDGCYLCHGWSLILYENIGDLGSSCVKLIEGETDLYDVVEAGQFWSEILKIPLRIVPGIDGYAHRHQIDTVEAEDADG